jgi:probable rRNA maturation factor
MRTQLTFQISNTTKGSLPRLPFASLKEEVLGDKYELSLVIAGDALSRKLNLQFRGKNKPTNVLSFPLTKKEGEIFLNLKSAKFEASDFGETYSNFVAHLFIHGLFHLKGYAHGSRMELEEKKVMKKFGFE